MGVKRKIFLSFFLVVIFAWGEANDQTKQAQSKKFNPDTLILKHIKDSHFWHLWGKGPTSFSLPLPIILWDKGFKIFLSSEFEHGEKWVEKKGSYYKLFKDKIYETNHLGELKFDLSKTVLNKKPLDLSLTKNAISCIFSLLILSVIFIKMRKSYKNYQSSWWLGRLLEPVIVFIRDQVAIPTLGSEKYKPYLPFLLSCFFFILIGNFLGLLPGGPNLTGNINITFVLALATFLLVNINGSRSYWRHIFWMPGVPIFIKILLMPMEIAGIFIRPMTLCIRLFANVTAGHIVILSFISLIFIFKSIFVSGFSIPFALFISLLEVLVAFLQAFIFITLSALFISMAIEEHNKKSNLNTH